MPEPVAKITTYGGKVVQNGVEYNTVQHWQLAYNGTFIFDVAEPHLLVVMYEIAEKLNAAEPPWEPTNWWRVLDGNDQVWCETSDETEARDRLRRASDNLERLYSATMTEWRTEDWED